MTVLVAVVNLCRRQEGFCFLMFWIIADLYFKPKVTACDGFFRGGWVTQRIFRLSQCGSQYVPTSDL